MTGYASARGGFADWVWTWDIRSVNGRGLDLRPRVPDWIEGLEPAVRKAVQDRIARGNVTVSLRLSRISGSGTVTLNPEGLTQAVANFVQVEEAAAAGDLRLAPATAADLMAAAGVFEGNQADQDTGPLRDAVLADLPGLIDAFDAMRGAEGQSLRDLVAAQVDMVEALVADARALEPERAEKLREGLRVNLARVVENASGADPDRVAQELALIAVKADVTEELDRLTAHVAAARALLDESGPKGRKLDFLTQEFNREANTLCAKAQHGGLTRVGLDLKHVIDQMREQVQNVE